MARYAEGTSVSVEKSKAEIERLLSRYGATAFASGWAIGRALIQFEAQGRRIRFVLPLPDPSERRFTHSAAKDQPRTHEAARAAWEQACRQDWRALALVVKAKLEAVAANITSFEQEFYAHIVLPNGETVFTATRDAVETAYRSRTMQPLLPDFSRTQ